MGEVDEAIEVAEDAHGKVQEIQEEINALTSTLIRSQEYYTHASTELAAINNKLLTSKSKKTMVEKDRVEKQLAAAIEGVATAKEECTAINKMEEKLERERAHAKELIMKAVCVAHTIATQRDQEAAAMMTAQTALAAQQRALEARNKVEELRVKWKDWMEEEPVADSSIVAQYTFGSPEKRRALIDSKFALVGGSMRWMFGMSLQEADDDIVHWIQQCGDYKMLLHKSSGSPAHNAANHLLARMEGINERPIQSRFIMLRVAESTANQFVESPRNSWIGWVFQLEFFGHLHLAIQHQTSLTLNTPANTVVKWETKNGTRYYFEPKDLCGGKLTLRAGEWLIPTKWSQGCFDVLQLCTDTLRVVHVTVATTHSLKLRFVRQVLEKLSGLLSLSLFSFLMPRNKNRKF